MIHTRPDMQDEWPTYSEKRDAIVKMEAELSRVSTGDCVRAQRGAQPSVLVQLSFWQQMSREPVSCPIKKCDTCFGEKEPVMFVNHGVYIQSDPRQKGVLLFVPRGF